MKRDLAYWRFIHRTSGGWRGVRWCLNCLYGPSAWKRIVLEWWRDRRLRRTIERMTPKDRRLLLAGLEDLAK